MKLAARVFSVPFVSQYFRRHVLAASQRKYLNADVRRYRLMQADSTRLNDLSGYVIGCVFTVLDTLGVDFFGKIHENAVA